MDMFVPDDIDTPEAAEPWRYFFLLSLFVAPAFYGFALQYLRLGANLGASFLIAAATLQLFFPWLAKRTHNLALAYCLDVVVNITTVGILTLSKGHFTLSTMIWLATVPLVGQAMLGQQWLWRSMVVALLGGATIYTLIQLQIFVAPFHFDPKTQEHLDFATWVLFTVVLAGSAFSAARAKARTEKERKRLGEMVHGARRMQAIGELAGGVAHEFNNLLTVITGTASFISENPTLDVETREGLVDILNASRRGGEIANELLTFSRGQEEESGVADPVASVGSALRLLRPLLGEHIDVVQQIPKTLPQVTLTSRALEQTIINLALNARDAMPKGGSLRISLSQVPTRPDLGGDHPGPWVRIEVADDGVGMDEATKAHLFDPFYTTKSTGTGLGLAVVFGLIQRAGGHIQLASQLGVGTCFSIYLPPADSDAVEVAPALPTETAVDTEGARVLLVEDQKAVRRMARRVLERAGYTVDEAHDGMRALELIEAGVSIDLILTDVRMPRLSGPELVRRLERRGQSFPVVFMTGFAGSIEEEEALKEIGNGVLRKPFSPDEVLEAMAHALRGRTRRAVVEPVPRAMPARPMN